MKQTSAGQWRLEVKLVKVENGAPATHTHTHTHTHFGGELSKTRMRA